jgi:hypothetical protein
MAARRYPAQGPPHRAPRTRARARIMRTSLVPGPHRSVSVGAFVTIHENHFTDWSFGDGVGQYLERNQ